MNLNFFGKTINIILKPTNECNMRCSYCYHSEQGYESNKMTLKMFEHLCSMVFPYYENITLIWHGGEPLLMGLNFYEATIKIINKFIKINGQKRINIIFQTNAILINREWINFFKANDIQIGTSFDGLTNDLTRGNSNELLQVFDLMKKEEFPISAICVVTAKTIDYLSDNYNLFKQLGIGVKFNPVFKTELSENDLLDENYYINKMTEFLDLWFYDDKCNIFVDPFTDLCNMQLKRSKSCMYNSCLFSWVSVDCNGMITPCGRNYSKDYCMGNISDYKNIQEAFLTDAYVKLLAGATERRSNCQKVCPIYDKCQGGCNNDAILAGNLNEPDRFHCDFTKAMLKHLELLLGNGELKSCKINQYVKKLFNEQ